MKRIGYVLAEFPVLSETFVITEMHAMSARGHLVQPLLLGTPGPSVHDLDAEYLARAVSLREVGVAARLRRLFSIGLLRVLGFVLRQRNIPAASLLWHGAAIAELAVRTGCQHLHAHFAHAATSHALVAARLAGISVSFVGHGFDVYGHRAGIGPKLEHTDFAVAVCRDMLELFRASSRRTRCELIPCGIDPGRFRPALQPSDHGRLLFVGRLVEKKGLDTLLQALSLLPASGRPLLDVVGDGPLRAEFEQQCARLGVEQQVCFLGSRRNDWLVANGSAYAALVAPFRLAANGDRDTGPVVAKEAMALGLPVIASDFMGLAEIVEHGSTGYLVPAGDARELANALLRFRNLAPSQLQRMRTAARARVESLFDARQSAAHLSSLVESV